MYLIQSISWKAILFGNTLTNTPNNNVYPDIWISHDSIKLIHKSNRHKVYVQKADKPMYILANKEKPMQILAIIYFDNTYITWHML